MMTAFKAILFFLTFNIFLSVYAFVTIPQPMNYMYLVMIILSLILLVGLLLVLIQGDLDD